MSGSSGGVNVELSSRTFAVPFECPCCGAVPDAELTIPLTRGGAVDRARSARGLEFPYCKRCIAHSTQWEAAGILAAAVTLGGIVGGVVVAAATKVAFGALFLVAAAASGAAVRAVKRSRAKAGCGPSCASAGKAVAYFGWSNAVSAFSFESPSYAARFAEQNGKLLANASPQLRTLLEGFKIARLQVPTPAAPAGVVPPPLTVIEWITKIERSPGRVARRTALAHALDMFPEAPARTQVLEAATREELAPYLRQLDASPDTASQLGLLDKAIAEVLADNLPEPLQRAVLAALEARAKRLR